MKVCSSFVVLALMCLTVGVMSSCKDAEPALDSEVQKDADLTAETDSSSAPEPSSPEDTGQRVEPEPNQGEAGFTPGEAHVSCSADPAIVPITNASLKSQGFDRKTLIKAPNGKEITIIAQPAVSDEKLIRARSVLVFFLTDVPGSQYGADKRDVANKMADHGAMLMLPGGAHEEGKEPNVNAQPLYDAEITLEGSSWYVNNEWDHRDATFEEIFHLVHDTGIGTYMPGALPAYQAELLAEAKKAIADGRWGIAADPGVAQWLKELEEENSLAQEYIASVIDSYYGYWGAFTEAPGGMWGIYIAKTRAEIGEKDPAGKNLLEKFLPPYLNYQARIDAQFKGIFSMTFDANLPYTHKSQYLVHARLMGSNDNGLKGNDADNILGGNSGANTLDGAGGHDVVVYCGKRSAYTVSQSGFDITVTGPDGKDTLTGIEAIHFADGILKPGPSQP